MTHEEYKGLEKRYRRANWALAIIAVFSMCIVGFFVYKMGKHV